MTLLIERPERDADQREKVREPAERRARHHDVAVVQHQDDSDEPERDAEPLSASDRLAHEAVGNRRREDGLQPHYQRRYPRRHALADRHKHAAKTEAMHHRARCEAVADFGPGRKTRAANERDRGHQHDHKGHAYGQKRQRLDVRQAVAGADEAGAPKKNKNDRGGRDRQLREARWFSGHWGFAADGRGHAYTIFYAAFPCPPLPDGPLCTCRMGTASGFANMKLLVVYMVFVAIGQAIAYGAGRIVEMWSPATSLPVFLSFFFFVLWAAWRLAVKVA